MHCDQGEGWQKEQEPEAIPFQQDMKYGVSSTCFPQIGSARTLVPGSFPSPPKGKKGGLSQTCGKRKEEKNTKNID